MSGNLTWVICAPFCVSPPFLKPLFPLHVQVFTKGCETSEMTLRRNGLGQLGFHVNYEGIVAEVSFAT